MQLNYFCCDFYKLVRSFVFIVFVLIKRIIK